MSRPMHRHILCAAAFCIAILGSPARSESVRVLAAASMGDVIDALGTAYRDAPGGRDVVPITAGSGVLARQIAQGVPADIYVSANRDWVDWLAAQGIGGTPVDIAGNVLVWIALSPDPAAEALRSDARIAIADPDAVPAGAYARQSLEASGIWSTLLPRFVHANNVRDALGWVLRGHAGFGLVYATDAAPYPQIFADPLPPERHEPIRYLALPLTPEGTAFADFLTGPQAQAILAEYGFTPASE